MSKITELKIDRRAYNFIKRATITSADDALVELITNVDDAYDRIGIVNKQIDIVVDYNTRVMKVVDAASGLTASEMEKCFMQVGVFSADSGSRGFFSRGAKDISSIGNVLFESIKDNRYSKLWLYSDSTCEMEFGDLEVDPEHRKSTGIQNNGLAVSVFLMENVQLPDPKLFHSEFSKILSLREIFSDENTTATLKVVTDTIEEKVVKYTYPKSVKLLDVVYEIPSYPGIDVRFTMFKSVDHLDKQYVKNQQEYGFIIKSDKVVHDIDDFSRYLQNDPDIQSLWGVIDTPHINTLMRQFDIDNTSAQNPHPIIDPNRINGVSKKHPFYLDIIKLPIKRIRQVLDQMDGADSSGNEMSSLSMSDLIDGLDLKSSSLFNTIKLSNVEADIDAERNRVVKAEESFSMNNDPVVIKSISDTQKSNDVKPYEKKELTGTTMSKSTRQNQSDVGFKLLFKNDVRRNYKVETKIFNNLITIKINVAHKMIKNYLDENSTDFKNLSPEGKLVLTQILTDSFTKLLMRAESYDGKIDIRGSSTADIVNNLLIYKEKKEKIVEELVFNILN